MLSELGLAGYAVSAEIWKGGILRNSPMPNLPGERGR